MRTIPIHRRLTPEHHVGRYDDARQLISDSSGPFAVINCICRQSKDQVGDPCKLSDIRETCITIQDMAEVCIDNGIGRDITKDETLALPERAEEVGMVLQPENNQKPLFVCCCCGCCCGVLTSIKKFPHSSEYFHSNFFAEVDPDLCEGCETCLQRCRMDAISLVDKVAEVDRDRCIGCGLCVTACETNAMELKKKEQEGPDFNVVPVFSLDCRRTVNRSFREQGHIEIESQPGPLADSGTYPIYSIFGINAHLMNQSPVSGSLSRQTMPPF